MFVRDITVLSKLTIMVVNDNYCTKINNALQPSQKSQGPTPYWEIYKPVICQEPTLSTHLCTVQPHLIQIPSVHVRPSDVFLYITIHYFHNCCLPLK